MMQIKYAEIEILIRCRPVARKNFLGGTSEGSASKKKQKIIIIIDRTAIEIFVLDHF